MAIKWFDTSAMFEVFQKNGQGFSLRLQPGDNPDSFRGFAQLEHGSGDVSGTVSGDRIAFTIKWGDGKVGGYYGYLYPDGRIRGTTSRLDGLTVPDTIDAWDTARAIFGVGIDTPIDETDVGWWSGDGYQWER